VTILAVHNRYRTRAGEDVAFDAETSLLEAHGHRLERLVVDNSNLTDPGGPAAAVRLAARSVWSSSAAQMVRTAVTRLRPDVVHVHNFVPLLSPAIYSAAREAGPAVVQTLHNYRLICPKATLYRDGHVCEDCPGRAFAWPSIVHSCYRDSRAASLAIATMLSANRARGTWVRDVDLYLAVSGFLRQKVVDTLLPDDSVVVKPNFVADPGSPAQLGNSFLYVGRLAEDKGIGTLLEAWSGLPPTIQLRIVGDGPMAPVVAEAAEKAPNIVPVGRLPHERVIDEFRAARAVILPSLWYEGMPLVVLEAFAAGRPVIASHLGAAAEMVDDSNGLSFPAGDAAALRTQVAWLVEHDAEADQMAAAARTTYLANYAPEPNYRQLVEAYDLALRRRRGELDA
jgi:glycosyltransferase involved in cell wall biosynthesis